MDGTRFDTLARAFTTSRRCTVKSLLGAAVGALVASRGAEQAVAACKKLGKWCDKDQDCCNGSKCRGGKCRCKIGHDECSGKCYDLDKDENRCGACNAFCALSETCCDGQCADLTNDDGHCGRCDTQCEPDSQCRDGDCVPIDPV